MLMIMPKQSCLKQKRECLKLLKYFILIFIMQKLIWNKL